MDADDRISRHVHPFPSARSMRQTSSSTQSQEESMKNKKLIIPAVSLVYILLAVCAHSVFAQSTFSTLVGTATDPQSAVVAGATVTVTNKGTTATRTGVTDNAGNYTIPNLDFG